MDNISHKKDNCLGCGSCDRFFREKQDSDGRIKLRLVLLSFFAFIFPVVVVILSVIITRRITDNTFLGVMIPVFAGFVSVIGGIGLSRVLKGTD